MKQLFLIVALIGSGAISLSVAYSKDDSSRPDGIPLASWIAIGTDSGLVITHSGGRNTPGISIPSLSGYFVARKDGKWVMLEPELTDRFSHTT